MKYLILCEGTNEQTIINILLDAKKLKFTRDDLVGLIPYHARQLSSSPITSILKAYNKPVTVLRIGDTQREALKIPNDLKRIVDKKNIFKYCTMPEFEILLIIGENLLKKYKSSKESPHIFAEKKHNI